MNEMNRGLDDIKTVLPSIRPSALREVAIVLPNVFLFTSVHFMILLLSL